jgi:flagellar hook-associated protein 3 FlgL
MRIAGTSYGTSMAAQINSLAAQQYKLQNQATTGQKITAPEDDPAGMVQALGLQADGASVAQYAKNISMLQNRSSLVANALQQLQTVSNRIGDLSTQSDGTASPTQLQANATETTQLIKQAVDVMNSMDSDGNYLFGGTASGQPPYVLATDANGAVTGVTYQGNSNVAESEIGQSISVSVDVPGENNSGSGVRGLITDSRYGADFFNHLISFQNDLKAGNTSAIATNDVPALNKDQDNLTYQVAENGAVSARLLASASAATTRQNSLNTSLTNVAGADLTQTITQLTQVQNAYEIAMQTSASFMQMRSTVLQALA